ncbi:NAD-dependent epimerase/dehydratase family protein [Streptomyces sp. URMC 128]|uniref:NAD-dependent epimerase/dehydratase family protein n=1 Tax=Streptomyces sp. URMC 128 TaxID=3423404 RepID=UPI003F1D3B12
MTTTAFGGVRPVRVVLTGATGFVGSAVLRRLLDRNGPDGEVVVHALVRSVPPDTAERPGVRWQTADITDPRSLDGIARGADVLIHLASRVSGDEAACTAVNTWGTQALMAEARRFGVRRVVHLSTAAVYGPGPHRGIDVDEITPAPVSPASRSRLAAEEAALAAGAVVLRPGLVLGTGDRWVVPALAELLDRVPARWDGGRGLLSLVDVDDLARLIVSVACGPAEVPPGTHHASHPVPVSNRDLMKRLTDLGVLRTVAEDWPWQECLRRLRETPGQVSERQFALLAQDHWYRSEEIWRAADCPEGAGPLTRLAAAAAWYRDQLSS